MAIYQPVVPSASWPKSFTFSPGVRVGNLVFLSGTTATDEKGRIVGVGDIIAQTRHIFQKFAAVMAAAGGGLEHIVKITQFLLHLRAHQPLLREVRAKFNNPELPPPASTMVQIGAFTREGALYEVEAVAVLPPA